MTPDNKNLFLAIGLSILVIVGWQYFYGAPQLQKAHQTQVQLQQPATVPQPGTPPGAPSLTPSQSPAAAPQDRSAPEAPAATQSSNEA